MLCQSCNQIFIHTNLSKFNQKNHRRQFCQQILPRRTTKPSGFTIISPVLKSATYIKVRKPNSCVLMPLPDWSNVNASSRVFRDPPDWSNACLLTEHMACGNENVQAVFCTVFIVQKTAHIIVTKI